MSHCDKHGVIMRGRQPCSFCVRGDSADTLKADEYQCGGSHYQDMAIQPWDVMQAVLTREEFVGFLKGNVLKYSLRAGKKAGADDDADKAKHYAAKLREVQA